MAVKTEKKVVHMTTVHHPLDPRIYYKQCQSLAKAGYDVSLIAPESEDKDEEKKTKVKLVSIKKQSNRWKRMIVSTIEAYKKARAKKADYYHIHDPELLPVAWLLKKKSNVVIYDIHEDYETAMLQKEYLPKLIRKAAAKLYRIIESFFSRKLELVLAEKYYQEKYPRGKCILNLPLLNEKLVHHDNKDKAIENKVIYTGNVTVERGALIHPTLPLIDDQLSVYLIGRCPKQFADQMYDIAGEKKDQIIIEGIDRYIPKADIDHAYISRRWLAGIALFPPTDHYMKKELTKFFEYMAAGLPIICSNFPVWKDFVQTHECGIAVDPFDKKEIKRALDYLRENEDMAIKMGKNGKKAVLESLNWEVEEKKLIHWYEEFSNKN